MKTLILLSLMMTLSGVESRASSFTKAQMKHLLPASGKVGDCSIQFVDLSPGQTGPDATYGIQIGNPNGKPNYQLLSFRIAPSMTEFSPEGVVLGSKSQVQYGSVLVSSRPNHGYLDGLMHSYYQAKLTFRSHDRKNLSD